MQYLYDIPETIPPESSDDAIDFFKAVFGNNNPLIIEIGLRNGHFLVEYSHQHPENNYILSQRLPKFYF